MVVACPACGGRGQVVKEFCEGCRGKGRVPRKRKIAVRIPPGIHDGQAVRVRGEGEPPPEGSGGGDAMRGDLHVVVRVQAHGRFRREGDHLVMEMPVSFAQAALGADVAIKTLDGEHAVTIPRGTQHGTLFRVDGAGLPDLRNGVRGDLVVVTTVEIPKKLTNEQEKHLRDYAATENLNVAAPKKGFFDSVRESLRGGGGKG
jgi:molecular chaperone DnaJ